MSFNKFGVLLEENSLTLDCPQLEYVFPDSNKTDLEMYNDLFDMLDIYNSCKKIYITTDYIYSLPSNLKKFKVLELLIIDGSRFWDITEDQIPSSIKILDFYNIYDDFWSQHGKLLNNLESLITLCDWEHDNYNSSDINDPLTTIKISFMSYGNNSLPLIPTLKSIELEFIREVDNIRQLIDAVNKHTFFKNYQKITKIITFNKTKFEDYICYKILLN
jgi:hypothetical protein